MTDPAAESITELAPSDAVPVVAVDWTDGGKKPEREGPRCENPACRQVLMIVRKDRRYCARCDREAGRDPHRWEQAS